MCCSRRAWLGADRFPVPHVVSRMRTIHRQVTVVLLLSSDLLATAGTWLHRGHECSSLNGTGGVTVTGCGSSCSPPDLVLSGNVECACAKEQFGWRDGKFRPEHRHQSDQCLLCRFPVIKKAVVISSDLTTLAECLPQQVTVVLPAVRVADLLVAPDCRAPPHMA